MTDESTLFVWFGEDEFGRAYDQVRQPSQHSTPTNVLRWRESAGRHILAPMFEWCDGYLGYRPEVKSFAGEYWEGDPASDDYCISYELKFDKLADLFCFKAEFGDWIAQPVIT